MTFIIVIFPSYPHVEQVTSAKLDGKSLLCSCFISFPFFLSGESLVYGECVLLASDQHAAYIQEWQNNVRTVVPDLDEVDRATWRYNTVKCPNDSLIKGFLQHGF